MKRSYLVPLFVAAAALTSCVDDPIQPEAASFKPQSAQVVDEGRYIVELSGANLEAFAAATAALGGTVEFAHAESGLATVSGITAEGASQLANAAGVAGVHEDVSFQIGLEPEIVESAEAGETLSPSNPTTAVLYSWQWNMRRVGANAAWAANRLGSPAVTVAILDSGIDPENLDMAGRIDVSRSRSFVASDDAFITQWVGPNHPKFDDLNGHGTNVATQVSSNAIFLAGVTSRTTLLAIKVLGRTGSGSLSGILNGLIYAADQGADIANMSLGVPGGVERKLNKDFVKVTNRVFNYAHKQGMLVIVSAGNDADDMDAETGIFRAYCEASHVICVSATGPTASTNAFTGPWTNEDAFAGYSNFGRAISVSAPGGTNRGWVTSVCARRRVTGFRTNGTPVFGCLTPTPNLASIVGYAGTSQAAPHVAGLAALLVEQDGKKKATHIKNQLIKKSVDDLGAKGDDPLYGRGRINVAKALGLL